MSWGAALKCVPEPNRICRPCRQLYAIFQGPKMILLFQFYNLSGNRSSARDPFTAAQLPISQRVRTARDQAPDNNRTKLDACFVDNLHLLSVVGCSPFLSLSGKGLKRGT